MFSPCILVMFVEFRVFSLMCFYDLWLLAGFLLIETCIVVAQDVLILFMCFMLEMLHQHHDEVQHEQNMSTAWKHWTHDNAHTHTDTDTLKTHNAKPHKARETTWPSKLSNIHKKKHVNMTSTWLKHIKKSKLNDQSNETWKYTENTISIAAAGWQTIRVPGWQSILNKKIHTVGAWKVRAHKWNETRTKQMNKWTNR